ncbi:hypothetical protein CIB48_g10276 [Xylaria polymorpha]|nr:hypothetical protein CIB48_g10276 [Xylaria polymorpha]
MAEQTSPPPVAREKLDAQIKSADMAEDLQQEAIDIAQEAMGKFTIEKDIAQHIKKTRRNTSSTFISATALFCSLRLSNPLKERNTRNLAGCLGAFSTIIGIGSVLALGISINTGDG